MNGRARDIDSDLQGLRARTLRLAGRVENMVVRASRAMVQRDRGLASQTIDLAPEVERMATDIDADCVLLLDRWRPGGAQLRALTFTQETLPHLTRISALAAAVSDKARALAADGVADPLVDIGDMGAIVSEMLGGAIDAFVNHDAAAAAAVIERDATLDERYHRVRRTRMRDAQSARGPDELLRAMHARAVARHLERMGDHTVSIAENVLEMVNIEQTSTRVGVETS